MSNIITHDSRVIYFAFGHFYFTYYFVQTAQNNVLGIQIE